ncbi:leucine-rich repeat domain-containing protein [Breznakiellaceae bacterium SP9]
MMSCNFLHKPARAALLFTLSVLFPLAAFAEDSAAQLTRQSVGYNLRDNADLTGNKYISYASQRPSILTFVNADGTVTVCSADESAHKTYIYEYTIDMKLQKTYTFPNEFDDLGAFTKDSAGNYYFFYGQTVNKSDKNKENMAVVKYNSAGTRLLAYRLKAFPDKSMDGIVTPFDAGTCRLEVSGSMIAVYFARLMFSGHQASYGFVLDSSTFERLDKGAVTNPTMGGTSMMPYVSHSFNQFILPINDGFLFADHGDAYPRGFAFARFIAGGDTKRLSAFKFDGGVGQNGTFAELGALAKTSSGYIFAGSYGKNANNPRNLLILTLDNNLSAVSAPKYITDYTKEDGHTAHPKITALGEGRYLLLWERCSFTTQSPNQVSGGNQTGYQMTYALLVDEEGNALSAVQELPRVRLNMNDTLRYNPQNQAVYWAINDGKQSIGIYAFPTASIPISAAGRQRLGAQQRLIEQRKEAAAAQELQAAQQQTARSEQVLEQQRLVEAQRIAEGEADASDFKFSTVGKGTERSIKITKYQGKKALVVIPEAIEGLPVLTIGNGAFTYAKVSAVILPKGVTAIENQALWYSELSDMFIPTGVASIGKQAFSDCKSLTTLMISGATSIGDFAFKGCTSLRTIFISAAVPSIGYGAFSGCTNLDADTRAELTMRFGPQIFAK